MSDRAAGKTDSAEGSGITGVIMPLSGATLQWRGADGAYRVLRADVTAGGWRPWSGSSELHIVSDAEVRRRPSWLLAWGEVPPGGRIDVLRTDDTPVPVTVAGRAWICEWTGHNTMAPDEGHPEAAAGTAALETSPNVAGPGAVDLGRIGPP